MPPPSQSRRPRTAFIAGGLPLLLRRPRHSPNFQPRQHPYCTASVSESDVPISPKTSPDRASKVRTRLESTRMRVRQLHSRAIVRAGSAGIALGAGLLREPSVAPVDVADADAVFGQLRRDLRALRRAADELPEDDPAITVVAQLTSVVDAVERRVAHIRNPGTATGSSLQNAPAFVCDEIEEALEGSVSVVEDMPWQSGGIVDQREEKDPSAEPEQIEFVASVRRKVVAKGDELKRKASNVGAGIEEKVAEYVKEDGSIDVDGLRSLVRQLLDNASMTWKRLNGIVPQGRESSASGQATEVPYSTLTVHDPEKEFEMREEIGLLEKKLAASSKEREAVLRREDQLGKLIRAKEIRQMDDGVSVLRRTLAVRVLQLEMEKIFVSVADEIENSDYQTMMEQRVLVAEFGDLDERLATLELFIDQDEPLLIEDDVLGELASDILELKTRLGLDEALYSSATLSWPQMRQFFASSARKTREGTDFYWRGLRLFVGDMRFALRLIRRAIVGYTPSPREIRTLRRTGRDLLTLVPFTIFLILPLTPVGHVLIFSFLQRYWPEFFPSTFSERRQAVMKRHEEYAKSLREITEMGLGGEEDVDERGGNKGQNGPLSGLRKALLFGVLAGEAAEEREGAGKGVVGGGSGSGTSPVEGNGVSGEGHETESEEHPVGLNNLAESVRDSEKVARKRRSASAMDELHLAD